MPSAVYSAHRNLAPAKKIVISHGFLIVTPVMSAEKAMTHTRAVREGSPGNL